jgi:hypothetical protein
MFRKKETKKCEHGWETKEEERLPYKRTAQRISVCPKCAIQSALNEMSFTISLNDEQIKELKEKYPELIK